ncbi:polysaccharide biosynthesis/export family protein [Litoribacter ruber]|uniref:Polysaccharide biosynthesis/export family protein n=1 Tax=Litoribacter ruber TaxID=702568 RepID=A0AAP2G1J9_9BACT|nr:MULTISPECIES: polysaccharide biosynthesis/export family protein [Litoribacter]MBS9524272.1 polysaccharide biosynthesis/export family protein [Litoribacter alkaliphilus]MBT0809930.1 polysaccharide biosynthesis/export family protein [Litoribacter ruber]
MQDLPDNAQVAIAGQLAEYQVEEYYLQINDVVDVSIRTTSPELNQIFLAQAAGTDWRMMGGGGGMMEGGDIFFLNGFTIDENGMIEIPLIGELQLVGLTTKQAKELVEEQVKRYVAEDDYFVRVRLGGIRYAALGEFARPGKFTILQNRVTIFEAIANAGDLTPLAKREQINLVRQYPEGSKTYKINLTNSDLLSSEFYFLRPNDMLYAEPLKARELGTGFTFIETFSLAISTLSAVLLVMSAIN